MRPRVSHTRHVSLFLIFVWLFFVGVKKSHAQPDVVFSKDARQIERQKIYSNLVRNSIQKNLSLPPDSLHAENWADAIQAMLLLQYRSPWTDQRIREALFSKHAITPDLSSSLFEYLHALQIPGYGKQAFVFMQRDTIPTHLSVYFHYLRDVDSESVSHQQVVAWIRKHTKWNLSDPIFSSLLHNTFSAVSSRPSIDDFLRPGYLPGNVFLLCLFREDRNYPGLCLVRDTAGHWLTDSQGQLLTVPILGRSQNNLPGYLSNGNTPEGLFRIDGYGQSQSGFIGPSTNIQLTLPFEYKANHFFRDSTLTDSSWAPVHYASLLPENWASYFPVWESYRAGQAGRNSIIIHGTTIDPGWYPQANFSPFIPTQGCLTTQETWDPDNGIRLKSDQQTLVDYLNQAGGPNGYLLVLNLNRNKAPVAVQELMPYIEKYRSQ